MKFKNGRNDHILLYEDDELSIETWTTKPRTCIKCGVDLGHNNDYGLCRECNGRKQGEANLKPNNRLGKKAK